MDAGGGFGAAGQDEAGQRAERLVQRIDLLLERGDEAGAIAAPAAVINALTDALGIRDIPMPATPQVVWQTLNAMKKAAE